MGKKAKLDATRKNKGKANDLPRRELIPRNCKKCKSWNHDAKLRAAVEGDNSRTIIDIEADGNCLFRSLSDQLYYDFGRAHADIRAEICDFLEANENYYRHFLHLDDAHDEADASDFDSYIQAMRKDGEWGGDIEISAATQLYRRSIKVFKINQEGNLEAVPFSSGAKSCPMDMTLSYHENQHYNSVRDNALSKPPTFVKISFDMPINKEEAEDNKNEPPEDGNPALQGRVKKRAPCPCGSGKAFRKCCLVHLRERSNVRTRRLNDELSNDGEGEMDGEFRVMKI